MRAAAEMKERVQAGIAAGSSRNGLRRLLLELATDGLTGLVGVRGTYSGRVRLHQGRIASAELTGRATLLVAMAQAELFSPEEWQRALRLPQATRWSELVGGDKARLGIMTDFAERYVGAALRVLDRQPSAMADFRATDVHPFGPLQTWSVLELLDVPDAEASNAATTSSEDPLDTADFLELLEEVTSIEVNAESQRVVSLAGR